MDRYSIWWSTFLLRSLSERAPYAAVQSPDGIRVLLEHRPALRAFNLSRAL